MFFRDFEHRHAVSILNANHKLKREIIQVVSELELELPRPYGHRECGRPHEQIQKAFVAEGWEPEVLVSPRTSKRHHFDLYKERVAIEIELSKPRAAVPRLHALSTGGSRRPAGRGHHPAAGF